MVCEGLISKTRLKRVAIVYAIVARVKAFTTSRRYESLRKHYWNIARRQRLVYTEEYIRGVIRKRLADRELNIQPKKQGGFRVFWVGANHSQDCSGILQGLRKFGKVLLFEGRPGKYGIIRPNDVYAKTVRYENAKNLISQVENALQDGPIDMILGQFWPRAIDPDALHALRRRGMVIVNLAMDDRHAFKGQRRKGQYYGTFGLIGSVDLACTAARECCLWYLLEGCPSIYLPEASDPEFFKPLSVQKKYDVCFVGAQYGIRKKIVKAIESAGIEVTCYGKNWPKGFIASEDIPRLFSESRIVLGVGTIGHCNNFYSLKMRDFDGPMSGSLYVTHHNPDLEELYDIGNEIVTYKTPEECASKIVYYLNHPSELAEISMKGQRAAQCNHTWEKRFEKIFRVLGMLH